MGSKQLRHYQIIKKGLSAVLMEYSESIGCVFVCQIESFGPPSVRDIVRMIYFLKLKIKVKITRPKCSYPNLLESVAIRIRIFGEGTVVAEFKEITQGSYSK